MTHSGIDLTRDSHFRGQDVLARVLDHTGRRESHCGQRLSQRAVGKTRVIDRWLPAPKFAGELGAEELDRANGVLRERACPNRQRQRPEPPPALRQSVSQSVISRSRPALTPPPARSPAPHKQRRTWSRGPAIRNSHDTLFFGVADVHLAGPARVVWFGFRRGNILVVEVFKFKF